MERAVGGDQRIGEGRSTASAIPAWLRVRATRVARAAWHFIDVLFYSVRRLGKASCLCSLSVIPAMRGLIIAALLAYDHMSMALSR
ncbi:hypothetical protein ACFQGW_10810 [Xanthomonas theicola]|uniref:hypothetical protein n=1 Tax=Xanthomonas theicola TaxID=56464 RepID=UPI003618140C